jgi:hypothetical protein
VVERYHPYHSPPSPAGDLLIVQRRPQWFPRRLSPLSAPSLGPALPWSAPAKVQDQPVDFSKKTTAAAAEALPLPPPLDDRKEELPAVAKSVSREFVFQRNLLVILIQNIRRNSSHGRRIVKFLQAACMSSGGGGVGVMPRGGGGYRQTGQGYATTNGVVNSGPSGSSLLAMSAFGGSSGNNFSRAGSSSGGAGGGGNNVNNNNNSFSGFSGVGGGGGGGSLQSSRSSSTDNEDGGSLGGFEDDGGASVDFDQLDFDFAESATRKWMAENPDLNPLKVLDHLQLRPDLTPGSGGSAEVQKPPDLAAMDRDTATFLQLAVPVPDPTQTFLDIGTDFGPISMYEDDPFNLEQLVPSTFSMEPQQQQQQHQMQQQQQMHHHLYNESLQKPVSLGVLGGSENPAKKYLDFGHNSQLQQHHQLHVNNTAAAAAVVTAFRSQQQHLQQQDEGASSSSPLLAHHRQQQQQQHLLVPTTHQLGPHNNNKAQSQQQHQQLLEQQQQLLSLDLSVKQEPQLLLAPFQIKEEPLPAAACLLAEPKVCADIMFPSPPTPSKSGGGGGRKRTVSFSEEEEDLSHLPSLQMRIQVLQQRVREERDKQSPYF